MAGFSTELLILILALLVLANGLLAMAETAVVSARKSKLRRRADAGDRRAETALALAGEPTRFLALVQFWLTLSGMIAGVLGGAKLYAILERRLSAYSGIGGAATWLAFALVTVGLTAFMLLFGELVPKRIGLAHPEKVAAALAGLMRALAWLASPFLWLLEFATDGLTRLFGLRRPTAADRIGEDEVRSLVEQGLHAGVFQRSEKEMVERVLQFDRLRVTAVMTPRPRLVYLNVDDPQEINWRKIVASGHSYFPVYQGNRDQILGLVAVKALWANAAIGVPADLRNVLVPPLLVPENLTAVQVLEQFRKTGRHIGIVTDEFGAVQGMITLADLFEAIVGEMPEPGRNAASGSKRQADGSWILDAALPVGEVKSLLSLEGPLPQEQSAEYLTLGGFVLTQLGRIPGPGDAFEADGWRFEVTEMDRRRVARVLVAPLGEGRGRPTISSRR
ncbi:MAG: hemolysin family protein [Opitutaceae bacterium]